MSERLAGFGKYLYSDPKGLGIEEIQIRTGEYICGLQARR